MKTLTRFLTVLLLAGSCSVFAHKLPKRETVHLPRGRSITMQARVNKLGHA